MSAPKIIGVAEEILAKHHAEWKAKIHANGQRLPKEWIGKTPDSQPPPSVRLRIVDTWDRRDFVTGVPFGPVTPDIDHLWPLVKCKGVNGNRESNMRPIFPVVHKKKTAKDNKEKNKADRSAKKHMGLREEPENPIPQRPKPERSTSKLDSIRALGAGEIARRYQNGD
jgi:hypothetical protein